MVALGVTASGHRAGAAAWGPDSLPSPSNIRMFLDADTPASLTLVGSKVSAWANQAASGLASLDQATDANRPTNGATRNGRNVMTFASNSGLSRKGGAGTLVPANAMTAFLVAAPAGSQPWGGGFFSGVQNTGSDDNGGQAAFALRCSTDSSQRLMFMQDGGSQNVNGGTNSWSVYTVTHNGSSGTLRQDGAQILAYGCGNTATQYFGWSLSGYYTSGAWDYSSGMVGDFGAVVIYNTVLSAGDRDTVEAALKTRWGTP